MSRHLLFQRELENLPGQGRQQPVRPGQLDPRLAGLGHHLLRQPRHVRRQSRQQLLVVGHE